MNYVNQYKVIAENPTERGWRFTQTSGKGKGRKIWIDKEKYPLNIVIGKSYIIKTNRDLDSDNIKNIQHIKLAKFSITEDNNNSPEPNTLDKCSDCKNSFKSAQEYWELKREGQVIMNSCINCWNKHSFSKKFWEN